MLTRHLKYFDWPLFAVSILLSLVGLVMIYSTGLAGVLTESNLWVRQLAALLIGIVGLFFFATFDYHFLKKSGNWLYAIGMVLLLAVVLFGPEIRGSKRWFDLGLFNFQPAEISKFALLVILAKYLQYKGALTQKFRYVIWSFFYVLVPAALIMLEPDLGSASVHVAIWLGLLLVSPMPRRYFLYLLVMFLLVSSIAWQFFLVPYQQDRIRSFLDPTADPLGRGYNAIQSIVAIGSGGPWGRGLARGLQSQLRFLPERQTDFIFASTVEELGLVGGGLVILLIIFLLWRIFKIAFASRDLFGTYLAAGIFFLFFTQVAVNIGMNLGLLPVTGITLPFLSYGGSSLVVTFWLVGILESVARHSVPVRFG
ncbi:MAG: rod shape-determining protein RodA [Candidatus Doudnabacteria bacterium]|nr:rod shape-determining protein RodA [Candidatus Doudnabacteria bacterium]